jgi:hypothetical protein
MFSGSSSSHGKWLPGSINTALGVTRYCACSACKLCSKSKLLKKLFADLCSHAHLLKEVSVRLLPSPCTRLLSKEVSKRVSTSTLRPPSHTAVYTSMTVAVIGSLLVSVLQHCGSRKDRNAEMSTEAMWHRITACSDSKDLKLAAKCAHLRRLL